MQNEGHDTHGEFDGAEGLFEAWDGVRDEADDEGHDEGHGDDHDEDLDDDCDAASDICPSCDDDSGSCRCFTVLSWEGDHLYDQWGPLDDSALDRVLRSGHALSLAGAPPSRSCVLLAGLPESLAAAIESYWVDLAALVPPAQLAEFRDFFAKESREALIEQGIDPDAPQFKVDPADARSPWHRPYLDGLLDRFDEMLRYGSEVRQRRISVHCVWAAICARETTATQHRIDGVGTSSVCSSLDSPDPSDTWRRMDAMLRPVLAKLDAAGTS